jgi:class 3 adenylate cyclase
MYPSIESTVGEIISTTWNITNGIKVPKTEDVVLKNGGKLVDATYLYADLAGSSKLAQSLKKEATAKIIKVYINTASRILKNYGGEIRSFDGDRVMAIFMGSNKNWNAVRAALGINWAVEKVIRPAIKSGWSDGADFCDITHAVGIDTGEALIVRGGVRDSNDLVSVGGAPNVAAKLSDIRNGNSVFVSGRVHETLSEELLTYDDGRKQIWSRLPSGVQIGGSTTTVYGSSVHWGV